MVRLFFPILFIAAVSLGAQTSNVRLDEDLLQFRILTEPKADPSGVMDAAAWDLSRYIGLNPGEAVSLLGPPLEVYTQRGSGASEDMVVFYYENHLYLYWFNNRVWQVRADKRYKGPLLGTAIGAAKRVVRNGLGIPYYEDSESFIYRMEDRGYPVKARLFFKNDILEDVYVYRGDY